MRAPPPPPGPGVWVPGCRGVQFAKGGAPLSAQTLRAPTRGCRDCRDLTPHPLSLANSPRCGRTRGRESSPQVREAARNALGPEPDTQGSTPAWKRGAGALHLQITLGRDFEKSLAPRCFCLTLMAKSELQKSGTCLKRKTRNKTRGGFLFHCFYSCKRLCKMDFVFAKWHTDSARI